MILYAVGVYAVFAFQHYFSMFDANETTDVSVKPEWL